MYSLMYIVNTCVVMTQIKKYNIASYRFLGILTSALVWMFVSPS